ncbi:hypothetical protein VB773_13390 [Haloarculaceae archaeon H-GB2-1]|nr:hypothetical protein [Haloarculaceae archaeon H-GB1-1]MEA5386960.1 hypothetical protein [Haloarculaceae archaeon H-GB11]MEA5408464.1 hypothetical protein [Haloarculaceae archaeon H-GB2-1]
MHCLSCDLGAAYNRAVVDVVDGAEVGSVCFRCERKAFGERLADGEHTDGTCAFCERTGDYALPSWTPQTTEAEGTVCDVAYELTERAPVLCDTHVRDLLSSGGRPLTRLAGDGLSDRSDS